jgi:hypothetical protein
MSTDRHSHEKFLEELARLDEALRRPNESTRPPIAPLDRGFNERRDVVTQSSDASGRRASAWTPPPRRRSLVPSPWLIALSGGVLASATLGWWLATHSFVPMASFTSATLEPSTKKPVVSRAAPSGRARRAAKNVAPSNATTPTATATHATASTATTSAAGESTAGASSTIVPNAVASSTAGPSTTEPSATVPDATAPDTIGAGVIRPPLDAAPIEAVSLPAVVMLTELPSVPSSLSLAAAAPAQPSSGQAPWPFPYKSAIASRDSIPSVATVPLPSIDASVRAGPPAMPNASTALAAAEAMAMVAADAAAIEVTLRQYAKAYERLDARAATEVWPTVDRRALSRAFAGLASQTLVFRGCEVVVRAGAITATASCRGSAEYVRKVGDARVHVEPRQWTFTLNKTAGEWRIDAVDGQR